MEWTSYVNSSKQYFLWGKINGRLIQLLKKGRGGEGTGAAYNIYWHGSSPAALNRLTILLNEASCLFILVFYHKNDYLQT
jgi:hypothetical protein